MFPAELTDAVQIFVGHVNRLRSVGVASQKQQAVPRSPAVLGPGREGVSRLPVF